MSSQLFQLIYGGDVHDDDDDNMDDGTNFWWDNVNANQFQNNDDHHNHDYLMSASEEPVVPPQTTSMMSDFLANYDYEDPITAQDPMAFHNDEEDNSNSNNNNDDDHQMLQENELEEEQEKEEPVVSVDTTQRVESILEALYSSSTVPNATAVGSHTDEPADTTTAETSKNQDPPTASLSAPETVVLHRNPLLVIGDPAAVETTTRVKSKWDKRQRAYVRHNLYGIPIEQMSQQEMEHLEELNRKRKVFKRKRDYEWQDIKENWKRRTTDVRGEQDDVGNALAYRAKLYFQKQKVHERQKKKQQQTIDEEAEQQQHEQQHQHQGEELKEEEEVELEDKGEEDEKEEYDEQGITYNDDNPIANELSQIFERMTGSQQIENDDESALMAERMATKVTQVSKEKEEALMDVMVPFRDKLDFWQNGRLAPSWNQLDFRYNGKETLESVAESMALQNAEEQLQKCRETLVPTKNQQFQREQFSATLYTISGSYGSTSHNTNRHISRPIDSNTFFHMPFRNAAAAEVYFLHQRQLMRVAARYITGSAGRMWHTGLEDRLVRAVWNHRKGITVSKCERLALLLLQLEEHGKDMEFFLSHKWKNSRARSLVAKRLGIRGQRAYYEEWQGSPRLIGRNMTGVLLRGSGERERKKLLRKFGSGPIPNMKVNSENPSSRIDLTEQSRIHPTVGYIHLPGTAPPTPAFPLDETNIIFGPIDRHLSYHHGGSFDEARYKLTLSSLLTRVATIQATHFEDHDFTQQTDDLQRLQEQLSFFVEQAPVAAKRGLHRFLGPDAVADIPQVQYYRTIMSFSSFVSSGCPQKKAITTMDNKISEGNELDDEERMASSDTADEVLTMDEVASKIYGFIEPQRMHNGLRAFPRLQITCGLACIARILPPSAAKILSSPLDGRRYRTPFDIFRRLLEYLEDEDMLQVDENVPVWSNADGDIVYLGELEYSLHRAALIFSKAIQRDPIDVSYHQWQLGALSASLLLCSGNKLGSKALPFPSSYYKSHDGNVNDDKLVAIRSTLPKFQEMLGKTTKSLKLLFQLCGHQPESSRAHLALSSFLEWKQVVALLIGHSGVNRRRIEDIRRRHRYHLSRWVFHERSAEALRYMEGVNSKDVTTSDVKLNQLAIQIENDPGNIEHWRSLATALGPVGVKASRIDGPKCDQKNCEECKLLRQGFAIDHGSLESRRSAGTWWGADLVSWWHPHLLVPPLRVPKFSEEEIKEAQDAVDGMRGELEISVEADGLGPCSVTPQPPDIAWLWQVDSDEEDTSFQSIDSSGRPLDYALPKPFEEISIDLADGTATSTTTNTEMDLPVETEAVYLKLAITCHLYGANHRGVAETIVCLARRSIDKMSRLALCSDFRCLQKLSGLGLDIPEVIKSFRGRIVEESVKKTINPPYTEAQRRAVRNGVKRFGGCQWKKIGQSYEALHGKDRQFLANVYEWMVGNEGLKDRRQKCKKK